MLAPQSPPIPDGAEGVGVLADDVLAKEGVDTPHDPHHAHQHLVQHGQLVAILTSIITLRSAPKEILVNRGIM